MREDYQKLFSHLESPEPPAGLFEKIMRRISNEQHISTFKWRIALFSTGVVGSIAAFIPVFQMAKSAFAESGFTQFFSLFFSDLELVVSHWQNFILALLESLPVMSTVALLATVFIFISSLKFLTRDINPHTKRG